MTAQKAYKKGEKAREWCRHILAQQESNLKIIDYCQKHGLNSKIFQNIRYLIKFGSNLDPDEYARICKIGQDYLQSSRKRREFAIENGIKENRLILIIMHLQYKDIISNLTKPQEDTMKFIKVNHKSTPSLDMAIAPESEILPSKNDIEISITQGVKVCISPNVDSMKIIKIIELLKDL